MDNESYQDKIDYTVLVFVDTGTQTKRKVRSALCSYLIYCSNHFMTRFDSNAACIFAICVWYLYKINKNSTNYSPKSSACGGQVFLKMYYFSACGGQNQGGLCVEWGGLAKTEPCGMLSSILSLDNSTFELTLIYLSLWETKKNNRRILSSPESIASVQKWKSGAKKNIFLVALY